MIFRSGFRCWLGVVFIAAVTGAACGGSVAQSGDDTTNGGGADASTGDAHAGDASTCTGAADCKCGTASCINGEWSCPRSCACPDSLSGLEGTSCDVDGLSCTSGDCSNPCNFCNILECSNGTWTTLEVFPEPCVDGSVVDGG